MSYKRVTTARVAFAAVIVIAAARVGKRKRKRKSENKNTAKSISPVSPVTTRRDWSTAIDLVGVGLALVVVFNAAFGRYFPNEYGGVGHDYAYFLPHLLSGRIWMHENGLFAVPWFTPAFCGGVPAFGNPQSPFYTVPQLLTVVFEPLASVHLTFLLFAWLGYAGCYLLLRKSFGTSRPAALLGAVLFMFNGLYAYRMVAGHLTFHAFMLTPLIAFLLTRRWAEFSWRAFAVNAAGAGALLAYMVYAGMVNALLPVLACLALIGLAWSWRTGHRRSYWVQLALAGGVALALSAAKLVASAAFLHDFQRDDYALPGASTLFGSFRVVVGSLFFAPQHEAGQRIMTNVQWPLDRHEYEYGVTFVPLLAVAAWAFIALWRWWRAGGKLIRPRPTAVLALVAAGAALTLPVALNYYSPSWNALLKQIPVLKSSSSMLRWISMYIPLAAVATGLALDAVVASQRVRAGAALFAIVTCLGLKFSADDGFYLDQRYDPKPVRDAHARLGEGTPEIKSIEARIRTNDSLVRGMSQETCYEPTFGYRLERFPRKQLTAGPVLADVGGVLNLKNPACYQFPAENGCAPGDHFTIEQRDAASAFAAYRPFAFHMSATQRIANVLSLLALAATIAALATAAFFTLRRRLALAREERGGTATGSKT